MDQNQPWIKLSQSQQNKPFINTNYSKELTATLRIFANDHHIKLLDQETPPIANIEYNEITISAALMSQSFPIKLKEKTYIVTCNPFNSLTTSTHNNKPAYVTTPSLFINYLANQIKNPIKGLWNLMHFFASNLKSTDITINSNKGLSFKKNDWQQHQWPVEESLINQLSYFIKLTSHLDPSCTNLPQDGAYQYQFGTITIDTRVATLPTQTGEMISLRLFHKDNHLNSLTTLGFSQIKSLAIKQMIKHNHGLILITGPTGSGKSTTLYSLLRELNHRHVITLEDPIEKIIPGIHQTNINTLQGYTMETGLKAILRHNPDVIAIGEIRDKKTAEIVLHAAYTGHLVIASLHTNSIEATLLRLVNLDCSPFMISYCLRGVIAQQLSITQRQNIELSSTILQCKTPFIIHDIKKELPDFLEANKIIK